MKSLMYKSVYIIMLLTLDLSVFGYPMANTDEGLVNKDEKKYPNGTVIGTYTYTDNEGNPIKVKYYADDRSYGVELKSVKMVNALQPEKQSIYPLQAIDDVFDPTSDPFIGLKDFSILNKNFTNNSLQLFKDEAMMKGHETKNKHKDEYETFLQNELKAPEKCGKERVKVYFDKDKRKTRNVIRNYDSIKYCNRF